MNRRALAALATVAAVLLAVLLLARVEFRSGDDAGGLHAEGLAGRLDDLQSLRVTAAGNEVVATIERGESAWVVAERGGHPADFESFRENLRALSEARRVERKTAIPEMYPRLGVEDVSGPDAGGFLLELEYGGKHPPDRFIVGNRAGAGMAYMRTVGEEQSWMVSADFDFPDQTRDWLDRAIIDLRSSEVRRVSLHRGAAGVLEIARDERDDINFTPANIPEGRELSYGSVANSIGSALANVEANDARRAEEVADFPQAVLARYETFDGMQLELDVREEPPAPAQEAEAGGGENESRYWVLFSARADAPPAPAPADGAPADGAPAEDAPAENAPAEDAAADDAPVEAGPAEDASDVGAPEADAAVAEAPTAEERAAELNAALTGWAYELPRYKSDQWFKTMDDLLKEEAAE